MYDRDKVIELLKWLKHLDNGTTHYDPETKKETPSIGFSPYDCFMDDLMTAEELLTAFDKLQKPLDMIDSKINMIGGYAKGVSANVCIGCDKKFTGHKLSLQCESCAEATMKRIENRNE